MAISLSACAAIALGASQVAGAAACPLNDSAMKRFDPSGTPLVFSMAYPSGLRVFKEMPKDWDSSQTGRQIGDPYKVVFKVDGPDNSELVLNQHAYEDANQEIEDDPGVSRIDQMHFNGEVMPIRTGYMPSLVTYVTYSGNEEVRLDPPKRYMSISINLLLPDASGPCSKSDLKDAALSIFKGLQPR